jgi:hypothetical protein
MMPGPFTDGLSVTRLRDLPSGRRSADAAVAQDAPVGEELHKTRSCDRVVALDEAAFFDELFNYLREIGLLAQLQGLDPGKREHETIPRRSRTSEMSPNSG